eukprot:scpid58168/ scgid17730/ 
MHNATNVLICRDPPGCCKRHWVVVSFSRPLASLGANTGQGSQHHSTLLRATGQLALRFPRVATPRWSVAFSLLGAAPLALHLAVNGPGNAVLAVLTLSTARWSVVVLMDLLTP